MKKITCILIFFSAKIIAQPHIDLSNVKADIQFCNLTDSQIDYNMIFDIPRICASPNLIEIRFNYINYGKADFKLIIISYDTSKGWNAYKYEDNVREHWNDSSIKRKIKKEKLI